MNLTVVIILAAIALGTLITGLVLSGRSSVTIVSTVEPELFPLRSNVRSLPPQSVSGIIPWGQASGDYSKNEQEEMLFAPSDWKEG